MRNIFSLTDIEHLKKSLKNASVANDCLMSFLNSYTFEDVYETEDESLVFQAGGKNDIEIEFFDFNHPIKRTCSIMYWENGKPYIVNVIHEKNKDRISRLV